MDRRRRQVAPVATSAPPGPAHVARALARRGLARLYRAGRRHGLFRGAPRELTVLAFHRIGNPAALGVGLGGLVNADVAGFDRTLSFLGEHFTFVSAELVKVALVDGERLPPDSLLLAAATIVAVPSDLEGFGIAAVEALAAGRPVVATAAGGLAEILEHDRTALLVPPGDPEPLARAIGSLLADEPRRRAMGVRARAAARERFGLRPWIRRIEDLYEELVLARRGSRRRVDAPSGEPGEPVRSRW